MRRPVSARAFNGVVIAEWYNVSNQWDQEVDWFQTHEHLLREGYVWVGVSAQPVGVHSATGLQAWSPPRYGALNVNAGGTITDNSLSYDIFSQAVKALRSPAGTDPLGSLPQPQYVIATGHSQSASLLRQYANSILPLSNILDAVVLHGFGQTLRDDLTRPVFRINSEGDVASLGAAVRQPDSATLRTWEVAGASHGDWKLITDYGPLRKRDIGTYPGGYPGEPQTCALPSLSRVPQHMVQNALYDHTVNWVAYGISPPSAPPITTTSTTPAVIARDGLGLALGGIRLSQHEVPLRVNSGVNTGPGFCFLDGSSVRLTDAQLAALYPTRAVVRRGGRQGHARQRQGRLHPALVHPRSRVVHGHQRTDRRLPRRRTDPGSCRREADRRHRAGPAPRRGRPRGAGDPLPRGGLAPSLVGAQARCDRHATRCCGRRRHWSPCCVAAKRMD